MRVLKSYVDEDRHKFRMAMLRGKKSLLEERGGLQEQEYWIASVERNALLWALQDAAMAPSAQRASDETGNIFQQLYDV